MIAPHRHLHTMDTLKTIALKNVPTHESNSLSSSYSHSLSLSHTHTHTPAMKIKCGFFTCWCMDASMESKRGRGGSQPVRGRGKMRMCAMSEVKGEGKRGEERREERRESDPVFQRHQTTSFRMAATTVHTSQ